MKKSTLTHPILFALFPAVSIVADHLEFIRFNSRLLFLAIILLLGAGIAYFVLYRLWQSVGKAAVGTSLSLILFFSYGHTFDFLTKERELTFIQHRHLVLLWLALYLALLVILFRTKRNLEMVNRWLTAVGTLLLLFSIVSIVQFYFTNRNDWQPEELSLRHTTQSAQGMPDIYYIILDAYANEATLNSYYGFDNKDFLQELEARGFYVAEQSRSNYALTSLSLSSSLNLNYLNEISHQAGENSRSIAIPTRLTEQNQAMRFLQSAGYQFVFLGSGYGISQENRFADVDVKCGRVDETIGRFIATSLLRAPTDRFRLIERDDRQRRLCMFHELANMPQMATPKFVFAHIPSPHWPFLFDQDGNAVSLENPNHDQLKEGYLAQLIYLNGRITQVVDTILQNSSRDPIIIIQSDHGPAFEFSMDTPSESLYQERMRILNVYYLPDEAKSMLYPAITPVNSFRLVFNYLFAAELPLLEDQSYFSTYQTPYQFTDVTESIVSR
ncbi:MAG: hypothetical protein CL608_24915 [Anaerolineaceae bacterium]|nr:hypothetical protein [Anaerolineaceae bacterium]